ncbi:MAG TPA: hypothetical protein VJY39_03520 [Acidisphaera sp.]|nr:hypothetical protein [Acidisphaera sp.]
MGKIGLLTYAVVAAAPFAFSPALAGTCQTDNGATCPTTMPVEGYCECNVHGQNVGGTVVNNAFPQHATAGSFQPDAPNGSPGRNMSYRHRMPPPPAPGMPPPPPGAAPQ